MQSEYDFYDDIPPQDVRGEYSDEDDGGYKKRDRYDSRGSDDDVDDRREDRREDRRDDRREDSYGDEDDGYDNYEKKGYDDDYDFDEKPRYNDYEDDDYDDMPQPMDHKPKRSRSRTGSHAPRQPPVLDYEDR